MDIKRVGIVEQGFEEVGVSTIGGVHVGTLELAPAGLEVLDDGAWHVQGVVDEVGDEAAVALHLHSGVLKAIGNGLEPHTAPGCCGMVLACTK